MKGTIEKRGSNSYRIQISLGKQADGSYGKIRETVNGTKKQAEARLAELLTELNKGEYIAKSNTKLDEFSEKWLSSIKNDLRPNTLSFYENCLRIYILPKIGRFTLEEIRPITVKTLINERPTVAKHVKSTLSACLSFAVDMEIIRSNPCQAVKIKRSSKKLRPDDVWGVDEMEKFLKTCQGEWYEIYFQLALKTGMRQGEILALRWSNVKDDAITVIEAIKDKKDKTVGDPKTPAGTRTIKIDGSLQRALKSHRAKQNAHRLKYGSGYRDMDLVMANEHGRPVDGNNIRRALLRLTEKASVPYIPPKNLRHTHATLLLQAGVHPKIVQERLGHEDVTLTLNTYSFVLENMQEKAVESFERLLSEGK